MRRRGLGIAVFAACAAAGVLSAGLLAATPAQVPLPTTTGTTTAPPPPPPTTTATTTTTTTTTTTAPPPARPATIAAGVRVAGQVLVGGLSPAAATAEVKAFFARPLTLRMGTRTFRTTAKELGASAYVGEAIRRARVARPGANVPLRVSAPQARLERYVRSLARRFDREPVDSRLLLRNSRPYITEERPGRRVRQLAVVQELFRSLKTHARRPVALTAVPVAPKATRASIDDVIVIRRGANKLSLYDGMTLRRTFDVATGLPQYPTPLGSFRIVVKWRNPWWYPPASDWAKDAKPIPPGPGNPLGTRWMGLSVPLIGIHGTPDAASIGYSASHGCIRMRVPEAEWLFDQVEVGTPVFIVR